VADYYQSGTPFIPARYQAAQLLDFARGQDAEDAALFVGTRLRADDIVAGETQLAPTEYLRLLENLATALPGPDTSFLLGQQLLPGHQGHASHALLQARNLRQAIDILIRCQALLSPLLAPHLMQLDGRIALYWTDSCVTPRQRGFVVEMTMTAVAAMSRWLAGMRLPWSFRFNRTRPAHIEQYAVHLGTDTHFDDYLDAMLIDDAWLDRPWPRGSETAAAAALAAAEQDTPHDTPRRSLLSALYDYLFERIRIAPTLERASADFGCSPATFKRHLALHGTYFQAELDLVRAHVVLYLMDTQDLGNDEIATYLGFHDANNFRRSFKRWTGLTPSMLRARLSHSRKHRSD
jgi:AraC-like DNA-binding protein